jgi:hypothetical protein
MGQGKVSKIENNRQRPSEDDIRGWCNVTGHPELTDELLDLRENERTTTTRWRKGLRASGAASVQVKRDEQTQAARLVRNADPMLVPGLLQTYGYARSVIAQATLLYGPTDVDAAVAARMQRQQVLYDTTKTFEFVFSEAALRMRVCSAEVMLGQLDRLYTLEMPHVTVGIIPFDAELRLMPYNTFTLLDDDLSVETLAGSSEESGGDASAIYHKVFDLLMAEALTGDDARQLIRSAVERLRQS